MTIRLRNFIILCSALFFITPAFSDSAIQKMKITIGWESPVELSAAFKEDIIDLAKLFSVVPVVEDISEVCDYALKITGYGIASSKIYKNPFHPNEKGPPLFTGATVSMEICFGKTENVICKELTYNNEPPENMGVNFLHGISKMKTPENAPILQTLRESGYEKILLSLMTEVFGIDALPAIAKHAFKNEGFNTAASLLMEQPTPIK